MNNRLRFAALILLIGTSACAKPAPSQAPSEAATVVNSGAHPTATSQQSQVEGSPACDFPSDDFTDISGTYTVSGSKQADSSDAYQGEATITHVERNCFTIEWHIGDRTRTGSLQVTGNIVSGVWKEGNKTGIVTFIANTDGTANPSLQLDGGTDADTYAETWTRK